jgi:hypothetical protein
VVSCKFKLYSHRLAAKFASRSFVSHSVSQAAMLSLRGIVTVNRQWKAKRYKWGKISVVLWVLYFLMFAARNGRHHPQPLRPYWTEVVSGTIPRFPLVRKLSSQKLSERGFWPILTKFNKRGVKGTVTRDLEFRGRRWSESHTLRKGVIWILSDLPIRCTRSPQNIIELFALSWNSLMWDPYFTCGRKWICRHSRPANIYCPILVKRRVWSYMWCCRNSLSFVKIGGQNIVL